MKKGIAGMALVILTMVTPAACGSAKRSATAAGGVNSVRIHLLAYTPDVIRVATGATVTWTQEDAGFHTVTSGAADVQPTGNVLTHLDGTFRSGKLATGKKFSFAFSRAGSYRYFCEIHPATMHGQVTAE